MNIKILQLLEGAKEAAGLTVIIDVFRAFSVECYIMQNGALNLYPVGDKEIAYRFRENDPGCVLVGERGGVKLPGFDYGNSPSEVENVSFEGRTVVHTTSAGTQGIANAKNADEIITGSLVNAKAIARYIKMKDPENVSLVCMGWDASEPTDEDTFCAEYIKSLLLSEPYDIESKVAQLKTGAGAKFFDPSQNSVFPQKDFFLSTCCNRFPFVLKVEKTQDGIDCIKKIDIL